MIGRSVAPAFVRLQRSAACVPPAVSDVLDACEAVTGYTASALSGPQRDRQRSYARHMTWYALYDRGDMSVTEIARRFGRDRSTVCEGIRRISAESRTRAQTAAAVEAIDRRLGRWGAQ